MSTVVKGLVGVAEIVAGSFIPGAQFLVPLGRPTDCSIGHTLSPKAIASAKAIAQ